MRAGAPALKGKLTHDIEHEADEAVVSCER